MLDKVKLEWKIHPCGTREAINGKFTFWIYSHVRGGYWYAYRHEDGKSEINARYPDSLEKIKEKCENLLTKEL